MKRKNIRNKLNRLFQQYPEIKLVYLFGSQARGKKGLLSDYDFAIYIEAGDKRKIFEIKLQLLGEISRILHTDKIDLIILNCVREPELKYNIIKEGNLIFEKKPYKLLVEPKILNEYFDFYALLLRHQLTRVRM